LETGSHGKLFSVTGRTKPVSYTLCLEYKVVDKVSSVIGAFLKSSVWSVLHIHSFPVIVLNVS